MVIHPDVDNTRVYTYVQFHQPQDQVDLEKEFELIFKHNRIAGVGSLFTVQFLSDDRTTVLSTGQFIVAYQKEKRITSDADPYQPVSRDVFIRKAEQIGEWWYSDIGGSVEHPGPRKKPLPEKEQPTPKASSRRTA